MEILVLIMLYYLTRNADFENTVKPLMNSLKNSESLLNFINDLSKFSSLFSNPSEKQDEPEKSPPKPEKEKEEQSSPASSIANDFIKETLEKYFKGH